MGPSCLRRDRYLHRVSATIARGKRPVPSRTRKLSLSAPMVLRGPLRGRVGRRRTQLRRGSFGLSERPSSFVVFARLLSECIAKGWKQAWRYRPERATSRPTSAQGKHVLAVSRPGRGMRRREVRVRPVAARVAIPPAVIRRDAITARAGPPQAAEPEQAIGAGMGLIGGIRAIAQAPLIVRIPVVVRVLVGGQPPRDSRVLVVGRTRGPHAAPARRESGRKPGEVELVDPAVTGAGLRPAGRPVTGLVVAIARVLVVADTGPSATRAAPVRSGAPVMSGVPRAELRGRSMAAVQSRRPRGGPSHRAGQDPQVRVRVRAVRRRTVLERRTVPARPGVAPAQARAPQLLVGRVRPVGRRSVVPVGYRSTAGRREAVGLASRVAPPGRPLGQRIGQAAAQITPAAQTTAACRTQHASKSRRFRTARIRACSIPACVRNCVVCRRQTQKRSPDTWSPPDS